jgi:hypothetical protein
MSGPTKVSRAPEELALFNPAYVAVLIARVIEGARREVDVDPMLPVALVATAIALDEQVRSTLTMTIRSHLGAWKYSNPAAVSRVPLLCRIHQASFRRGLMFGIRHRLIALDGANIAFGTTSIRKSLSGFSEDVEASQRAAFYLGRWLSSSGSAASVLALLGVRA